MILEWVVSILFLKGRGHSSDRYVGNINYDVGNLNKNSIRDLHYALRGIGNRGKFG
jgi:hypothetical protein